MPVLSTPDPTGVNETLVSLSQKRAKGAELPCVPPEIELLTGLDQVRVGADDALVAVVERGPSAGQPVGRGDG